MASSNPDFEANSATRSTKLTRKRQTCGEVSSRFSLGYRRMSRPFRGGRSGIEPPFLILPLPLKYPHRSCRSSALLLFLSEYAPAGVLGSLPRIWVLFTFE